MKEKLVEYLNEQIRDNVRAAMRYNEETDQLFCMVKAGTMVEIVDMLEAGRFDE